MAHGGRITGGEPTSGPVALPGRLAGDAERIPHVLPGGTGLAHLIDERSTHRGRRELHDVERFHGAGARALLEDLEGCSAGPFEVSTCTSVRHAVRVP